MRAPPPVEYPSVLGRAWRGVLAAIVAAAVGVPVAWGLPCLATVWSGLPPQRLAFAGMLVGCAVFALCWRSSGNAAARERPLRWDGREWLLPGGGDVPDQRGSVALMLDLGPWLLVRFLPHGARRGSASWLPFALADDAGRWAALRGALWTWRGDAARRP